MYISIVIAEWNESTKNKIMLLENLLLFRSLIRGRVVYGFLQGHAVFSGTETGSTLTNSKAKAFKGIEDSCGTGQVRSGT